MAEPTKETNPQQLLRKNNLVGLLALNSMSENDSKAVFEGMSSILNKKGVTDDRRLAVLIIGKHCLNNPRAEAVLVQEICSGDNYFDSRAQAAYCLKDVCNPRPETIDALLAVARDGKIPPKTTTKTAAGTDTPKIRADGLSVIGAFKALVALAPERKEVHDVMRKYLVKPSIVGTHDQQPEEVVSDRLQIDAAHHLGQAISTNPNTPTAIESIQALGSALVHENPTEVNYHIAMVLADLGSAVEPALPKIIEFINKAFPVTGAAQVNPMESETAIRESIKALGACGTKAKAAVPALLAAGAAGFEEAWVALGNIGPEQDVVSRMNLVLKSINNTEDGYQLVKSVCAGLLQIHKDHPKNKEATAVLESVLDGSSGRWGKITPLTTQWLAQIEVASALCLEQPKKALPILLDAIKHSGAERISGCANWRDDDGLNLPQHYAIKALNAIGLAKATGVDCSSIVGELNQLKNSFDQSVSSAAERALEVINSSNKLVLPPRPN